MAIPTAPQAEQLQRRPKALLSRVCALSRILLVLSVVIFGPFGVARLCKQKYFGPGPKSLFEQKPRRKGATQNGSATEQRWASVKHVEFSPAATTFFESQSNRPESSDLGTWPGTTSLGSVAFPGRAREFDSDPTGFSSARKLEESDAVVQGRRIEDLQIQF